MTGYKDIKKDRVTKGLRDIGGGTAGIRAWIPIVIDGVETIVRKGLIKERGV